MRYLITSLLCVFTLSLTAQVDCQGPDFNNDGTIGAADIIVFLTYYGDEWPLAPEISCGETIAHQDYAYQTVQIGDQCWFAENCRYLPYVSNPTDESATEPYYYVYDYEGTDVEAAVASPNYETYGVLYNWSAVITEGICPSGWHVPTDVEWQALEISLGMSESEAASTGWRGTDEGYQMKSASGWSNNGNGSNLSGFTGLPGGYYDSGGFFSSGDYGHWWSSSNSGSISMRRFLSSDSNEIFRNNLPHIYGFSARCVQDEN